MNKSLSRTILTGNQHMLIQGERGRTQTADYLLVLSIWHGPSLQKNQNPAQYDTADRPSFLGRVGQDLTKVRASKRDGRTPSKP